MASPEMKEMIKKKEDIESELRELGDVLATHKTNMVDELVDIEGFPRSDVDVLTIRKTRVRIIYLQNDLKKLMIDIENELHRIHAEVREEKEKNNSNTALSTTTDSINDRQAPFLRVELVDEGSPAAKAGLVVNDLITQFGSINLTNFEGLQTISSVVRHSKGEEMLVALKRSNEEKTLKLTPNTWSGKGLLGCSVVPYKEN